MTSRDTSTSIAVGIAVYRASRLEALLDPLIALLDSNPPDAVLMPQTVIAAHPGMRQWLFGALARKRGNAGIAANLDILLPSAWLDRLAEKILGERAVALHAYQRDNLRWRIHALLDGLDDPRIHAYLRGNDVARRRFQLADRLAHIYTQYLVYRPDWLQAWSAGRKTTPDPGFHAVLWRQLRTQIGMPHRAERLSQLLDALNDAKDAGGCEPLHVFGISHLAPSELAVLRAVARHRLVVLYVPDPCREFWAGMRDDRSRLRDLVKHDIDAAATETAFLEQGHPLLASWGRMGQHFMLALEDSDAAIDERHHLDKREAAIKPTNRLQRLQESIRAAEPVLIASPENSSGQRADRSLRIHACHTRLRELEVLRDALLRELSERSDLKPSEIVVMAPDIQAYAPLLPAVFGEAGVHVGPLPYHLADVAIARSHPLFTAFGRLLELPQSRLTAPEVIDLLAVPQVANRFGVSVREINVLADWLKQCRVAWALDGSFRARFDVPAISEHTFAWGMDRMLAGYAMGASEGDEQLVVTLPDGSEIAPLDGIAGPQAALIGALDSALVELARWCELGARPLRASTWAERLEERFDAIFRIDGMDRDAREAGTLLLRFIRTIASEPAQSGLDPELDFAVVRDLLRERMAAAPERQAFLMGGATFCGMVPQRAIPFRVVAVLGLNDGEFPRATSSGGLDLMDRHRRIGDRDVRNDDRYLFLQTVMSARAALHLSWIGRDVRDGEARNPAAPLAELLAALDAADGIDPGKAMDADADRQLRPWLVRHPLQPFDARYFDGRDAALFSYRADFAEMDFAATTRAVSSLPAPLQDAIAAHASDTPSPPENEAIILQDVLAWFKDPSRQCMTRRLKLRLDALEEERLADSESLEASVDAIETVAKRVFLECVAQDIRTLPVRAPAWLRLTGLLPPGRIGDAAWEAERDKARELLENIEGNALFAEGMPRRAALAPLHTIGDLRIEGELPHAYETNAARWIMDAFPGKEEIGLDFRQRIGLFIEWALLRLHDPHGERPATLCLLCKGRKHLWQDAINAWDARFTTAARAGEHATVAAMADKLRARVGEWIALWRSFQIDPRWYFPKTSWAAATSTKPDDPAKTWQGSTGRWGGKGERDYEPGYARLLARLLVGDIGFDHGTNDFDLLAEKAALLHALIEPPLHEAPAA